MLVHVAYLVGSGCFPHCQLAPYRDDRPSDVTKLLRPWRKCGSDIVARRRALEFFDVDEVAHAEEIQQLVRSVAASECLPGAGCSDARRPAFGSGRAHGQECFQGS